MKRYTKRRNRVGTGSCSVSDEIRRSSMLTHQCGDRYTHCNRERSRRTSDKRLWSKTSVRATSERLLHAMAVDGVCCEPLSVPNSLLTGNLTGKSLIFGLRSRTAPHAILHNSLRLASSSEPSRLKKNREFFRDNRELKFPVTVLSSEHL